MGAKFKYRFLKKITQICALFLSITYIIYLSCCGSYESVSSSNASKEYGSIAFNLKWSEKQEWTEAGNTGLPISEDVCIDYGIQTIEGVVSNASGTNLQRASWTCTAHQGAISQVPIGSGYTLLLTGKSATNQETSRGQKDNLAVSSDQTTNAGTIIMTSVGPTTTTSVAPVNFIISYQFPQFPRNNSSEDQTQWRVNGWQPNWSTVSSHGACNSCTSYRSFTGSNGGTAVVYGCKDQLENSKVYLYVSGNSSQIGNLTLTFEAIDNPYPFTMTKSCSATDGPSTIAVSGKRMMTVTITSSGVNVSN
jgi:hypothetical protein